MSATRTSSAPSRPSSGPDSVGHNLKALAGLTGPQLFQVVAALVTAPLIAQALGAEGRGLLAAIAVPLGIAGFMLDFGLGTYAINRAAQGSRPNVIFGSLALPSLVVGGIVAALSPVIAGALSQERPPVDVFLTIGFALMPISLLIMLAMNIALGLSLWRVLAVARLMPPLVVLCGVVLLYALGDLTVATAAAVTVVAGFAPVAALLPVFRRLSPPRVDRRLVKDGLSFGMRVWVGVTATMANQRLDQFLMIPLVPPRELGLYAVAVTIASLSNVLANQVPTLLVPRIAAGESHLVPQSVRCVLLVVLGTGVLIAVAAHFLLIPLFGSDFADARPLVLVLLIAWLSQAGLSALGQALPAVGRPGAVSVGEIISLAITIPGLVLLLPALGAMGAALVSLGAYTVTFVILIVVATRHLGHRFLEYLVPRRADFAMFSDVIRSVLARVIRRRETAAESLSPG